MTQQETTKPAQMTQGQSQEGSHKQNVQLGGAAELKKWDKRIGPRSVAAAARCSEQPASKQEG